MPVKQLDSFICPNCGGGLEYKGNGNYLCPYCDSKFHDNTVLPSADPHAGKANPPEKPKPATVQNIKAIVFDVMRNYLDEVADDSSALSIGETPSDHPKYNKARAGFGIPNGAEVWLIWDETFFGGCKYGFALTSEGIFSNYTENHGKVSITWKELGNRKIKGENYTVYLNKTELVITGSGAFEPFLDAFKELQQRLENSLTW